MLAVEIGEQLGLSPSRLRSLAIGGLLHDIGKLSVPESILQKPGPLDDDEYAVIKLHPERGRELLNELGGFDETVGRLVLDHHERLDGSGYPRGLRGEELDLATRILAVCDVYDALVSPRVYRAAWHATRHSSCCAASRTSRSMHGASPRFEHVLDGSVDGATAAPAASPRSPGLRVAVLSGATCDARRARRTRSSPAA